MFGYVIANKDIMTEAQEARYRACYCGSATPCGAGTVRSRA